ncbi:TPA: hypothetical protein QDZ84_003509 [Shewanella algae]|uniref:PFGI-1 class ICE element type IV pilus protein PilL2 n=1 Tax=Shewanella TaxID=22 RepID=UPI00142F6686|nr:MULTISPECIES: hypothetical protein [Shewanella]NJI86977.1 hypothetical protein [Shewanella sp. Iso12]HDS1208470.1 hypothetical protein [Shewanella algae]
MKMILFIIGIVFTMSFSTEAAYVKTDRYTYIKPGADSVELDPLSVNVQITFPPNVKTVGDAVRFVLLNSGWVLALDESTDSALQLTMGRPLPQVHRKLSLMPLRTALQVLVGNYYSPVEDPIRRIYSFDIKEEFKGLANNG